MVKRSWLQRYGAVFFSSAKYNGTICTAHIEFVNEKEKNRITKSIRCELTISFDILAFVKCFGFGIYICRRRCGVSAFFFCSARLFFTRWYICFFADELAIDEENTKLIARRDQLSGFLAFLNGCSQPIS